MSNKCRIAFRIHGIGDVWIDAATRKDALEKFADMEMGELAGWCQFSDFDLPSGIHIISVDDEEFQADLDEVLNAMEAEEDPTCT
jgi:hypothetical protein